MTAKTDFTLEGIFLGFADSPRYLHLETTEGRQEIKLSKEVCAFLYRHVYAVGKTLTQGARLKVSGVCKKDRCLKAYGLELLDGHGSPETPSPLREITVAVCHGKKCTFGGANSLLEMLAAAVSADPDLGGRVRVRTVGCQKSCKQAPMVIVGDERFSHVAIADIPVIIASARQHLAGFAATNA